MNLLKSEAARTVAAVLSFPILTGIFTIIVSVYFSFVTDSYWRDVYKDYSALILLFSAIISGIISSMVYLILEDLFN